MAAIKNVIKSTGVYFAGNVLSKIITFFMIPIYTKYIAAGDMGYYDSAISVVTFFSSVLFMDMGGCIIRFILEKKELDEKYHVVYNGLTIFIMSLILYTIIAIAFGFVLDIQYYLLIALYGFLTCLNSIYNSIARGLGANVLYAISGVIATIVTVVLNIVFIVVLGWDYKSLYISIIISMVVHVIILEFKCKLFFNFKKLKFDKELIKAMLKYTLPLSINLVAFWLLNSANKLIVSLMLDTSQNGYLAIANKFTQLLYLVSSCFQLAWQELAFSQKNKIDDVTGTFYSKAFDLYIRMLIIGLLILIPAIKLGLTVYPTFIDSSYADSIALLPLALCGAVMSIASTFLGSIFGGIKKTNMIWISTAIGAIVNLAVIFSLINVIGVMAANIAFLAGFTANVLARLMSLKKKINMKVNYVYFIIAIPVLVVVIWIFNRYNWIINLISLLVVAGIGIFLLRKEIASIFSKRKGKKI